MIMGLAMCLVGMFLASPQARAVRVPPPGGAGHCPSEAHAQYSYIGATNGFGVAGILTTKEISGIGCYDRVSATKARVSFSWAAVGPLYVAGMEVQLYDCTAHRWAYHQAVNYDHGTKSRSGAMPTKTWALQSHDKYRLLIWGTGKYHRNPSGNKGGQGRFYSSGKPYKHWSAWSGAGCS